MSEKAKQLIEWKSTTGKRKSLIIVKDSELNKQDPQYRRFELCSYDSSEENWETDEKIDFIDEITGFSIPETIIG